MIRAGETHFAHLWQLTFGGENAEAYWSGGREAAHLPVHARRLAVRPGVRHGPEHAADDARQHRQGPDDVRLLLRPRPPRAVLLHASRRRLAARRGPTTRKGYVWPIYADYDIFTAAPDGTDLQAAHRHRPATTPRPRCRPTAQWIVFTSVRDGDLDLYKMHTDGIAA